MGGGYWDTKINHTPPVLIENQTHPSSQLQEETGLLNSEERPAELEEVSEKIHKRFHIKETPGSSLVKVGQVVWVLWWGVRWFDGWIWPFGF